MRSWNTLTDNEKKNYLLKAEYLISRGYTTSQYDIDRVAKDIFERHEKKICKQQLNK